MTRAIPQMTQTPTLAPFLDLWVAQARLAIDLHEQATRALWSPFAAWRGVARQADAPLSDPPAPVSVAVSDGQSAAVMTGAPLTGDPSVDKARPAILDAPRDGQGCDLTTIKGVGPKLAQRLNAAGIWHLDQIAALTEAEALWIDENVDGVRGRATRDHWAAQAAGLSG